MMKKEDFRVGMKVRCYKKTLHPEYWEGIQKKLGNNPIGTICKIHYDFVEITFADDNNSVRYTFTFSDIGPTIKDEYTKYKIISDLTLANFIQKNPCQNELLKLIEKFPNQTKYTLEQVTSHQIWTDWLIKNGFIQENKPEKFYHIGQRFTFLKEEYILAQVNNSEVCLINLDSGNRKENPVYVNSVLKISQEGFELIGGSDSYLLVGKE